MTHLDEILASLPSGLDRTLMSILKHHKGKENAISRESLLEMLKLMGWNPSDRAVRAQINLFRKQNYLICSAGGKGGGYYFARNWQELLDYINQELHPRAMDLLEQERALKVGARREWGENSTQIQLI